MQKDSGGERGASNVHCRSRQADPLLGASVVVTFNYSYTDRTADSPVEEALKTEDSIRHL